MNLGRAPTFAASFRLCRRFFSCFSTLCFFSVRLLANGSCPGSVEIRLHYINNEHRGGDITWLADQNKQNTISEHFFP